jgi:transcriptional regulator with GAF, ATPase, and Fis domain
MQDVYRLVERVADTRATILIRGESGTGKELIARALHFNSRRQFAHFVPVNCSALPESLLESELFGHRRGAFTGAISDKKGLFEEADGGTIFLDEVGSMSALLQSRLLLPRWEGSRSYLRLPKLPARQARPLPQRYPSTPLPLIPRSLPR